MVATVTPVPLTPASHGTESAGTDDALMGRVLEGRYRIESRLGEGGLGSVYRARHLKLERDVAIKVLKSELRSFPDLRRRFEREVRALSALSHPNLVTITDYGATDDTPYLVMELAEGVELSRMVSEPLSPPRAFAIARQILSCLAYAHARDVVHRDLKPANVIVRELPDGSDHVIVLDFGLAKFVGDASQSGGSDLTRSGVVVGTPAYMAPEALSGGRAVDVRTDLYAAGLILYEMLAGRRPFLADEAADVLRAHIAQDPPTLARAYPGARVTRELEAFMVRALAKAPGDRFQTARAMIDAIDALPTPALLPPGHREGGAAGHEATRRAPRSDETIPASPSSLAQREARGAQLTTVGAFLALAILGGVVVWAVGARQADDAPTAGAEPSVAAVPTTTADVRPTPEAAVVLPREEPSTEPGDEASDDAAEAPVDEVEGDVAGEEGAMTITAEEAEPPPDPTAAVAAEPASDGPPRARPAARNPYGGRLPGVLSRARARLARDRRIGDGELRALQGYRNDHPLDPRGRLVLGHAYMQRAWHTAALEQYERAISLDGSVRGDPALLPLLLRMARSDNTAVAQSAASLVARAYGAEARAAVDRAIERASGEEAARMRRLRARLER